MLLEQLIAKGNGFSIFMTWRRIIKAIKSKYKEPQHLPQENLSVNELEVEVNQERISLSSLCRNKKYYREFVRRKSETRATILKLKDELSNMSDHEMEQVFLLPFKVLMDIKSRDFQYRFINRYMHTTYQFLSKKNLSSTLETMHILQ